MTKTVKIGNFVVFKRAGLWVVREYNGRVDLAHELTKADAIKVARKFIKAA
jgi:hypothetical protein